MFHKLEKYEDVSDECLTRPFLCFCMVLKRLGTVFCRDLRRLIFESLTTTHVRVSDLVFNPCTAVDEHGCIPYWTHFPKVPYKGVVGTFGADRCPDWGLFVVHEYDDVAKVLYVTHPYIYANSITGKVSLGDKSKMSLNDFRKQQEKEDKCECGPVQQGDDGFCRCGYTVKLCMMWGTYFTPAVSGKVKERVRALNFAGKFPSYMFDGFVLKQDILLTSFF